MHLKLSDLPPQDITEKLQNPGFSCPHTNSYLGENIAHRSLLLSSTMYYRRLPVILTVSALLTSRWVFGERLMPVETDGKMGVICVYHQTKPRKKKKRTTECSNLLTALLTVPFS